MRSGPAYTTYQQLLHAFTDGAMSVVEHAAEAASTACRSRDRVSDDVRTFCWLSGLVRRSIVISHYLGTLEPPEEERAGTLMPTLDWVLTKFAQHKVDLDTYTRMIDAELDGDEDEDLFEDDPAEPDPDADIPGRRPMVLVAELCRDFGMAVHALPPEWLAAVPAELRLFCARAAVAGVKPAAHASPIGHLMER